jgi:hypothetical protein
MNFRIPFPKLDRARGRFPRQRLDPIFGNEKRVLKLRRSLAIARRGRPVIRPGDGPRGTAFTNHGFNGEGMSGRHDAVGLVVGIVQDIGRGVEGRSNAVAAKIADRTVSFRYHVLFNDPADFLVLAARLDDRAGGNPAVVGGLQQVGRFGIDRAAVVRDDKHFRTIAVIAVEVDGNVEVDNIADGEGTVVWNAVANHLVDGGATGLGVAVIIQWGRIRTILLESQNSSINEESRE